VKPSLWKGTEAFIVVKDAILAEHEDSTGTADVPSAPASTSVYFRNEDTATETMSRERGRLARLRGRIEIESGIKLLRC
jgi:hypothetical protein